MDAFYASVEQRDNPSLRGKPVIVGGDKNSRGVVATCSYEAREFGIHSALASSIAYKKCPQAIFVRPRFEIYKKVSNQIREIFYQYSDLVEPVSMDEAYLDVTQNKVGNSSATLIAREIRNKIYKTTLLTASAGVSYNKFLAKIASDFNKPDGLTVITPEMAEEFIQNLKIGKFFGVGKVTQAKMQSLGIFTGRDLRKKTKEELIKLFGKHGNYYYNIVRGVDERKVETVRVRKSIGKETTLAKDITDYTEIINILDKIALKIEQILKRKNIKGRTITLKVRYYNFKRITRSITLMTSTARAEEIMENVRKLLDKTAACRVKIRLLGISLSNLSSVNDKNTDSVNKNQFELQIQ
jgi:DNA polymerase-4